MRNQSSRSQDLTQAVRERADLLEALTPHHDRGRLSDPVLILRVVEPRQVLRQQLLAAVHLAQCREAFVQSAVPTSPFEGFGVVGILEQDVAAREDEPDLRMIVEDRRHPLEAIRVQHIVRVQELDEPASG